ncbi:MAG: type II toxin-antitoxin system RelE/ParE family toxin [Candidatus Sumerlaeota bacterium]|nr:type II toxin-antitoxin system RelE/ParE family toxin [Candidatus Sumerlaeota bacterium]
MTYSLIIRPDAEKDLHEAYEWYELQRSGLGDEFILNVEAGFEAICRNPFLFPKIHKEAHRYLVRRFPYAVFYLVHENGIKVIAVMHCHRNPKLWKSRLQGSN